MTEPLMEESEKADDQKRKDFDDVLNIVGSTGRYQKLLVYGALGPISAIQAWLAYNFIFMLSIPNHWCFVPGMDADGDLESWKNQTLPLVDSDGVMSFSKCTMYDSYGNITTCQFGWDYDRSNYKSTISSEFDWVCSKSDYATRVFSATAAGGAIGEILFGMASDKFGRKRMYFIAAVLNVVSKSVSLFLPHWFNGFIAANFIGGMGLALMFTAPSLITVELCDKEYRAWVYSMSWVIWVIGLCTLPLVAWLGRTWMTIGMLTMGPGFFLLVYCKFLPESPRWLVSVGRLAEARDIILNIAKINGNQQAISKDRLDGILQTLRDDQKKTGEKTPYIWTLFSRKKLALNTTMLMLAWSMNSLIYEGITLNTPNMSGSQFVNFAILSIVELPSVLVGQALLDRVGRRWTQVAFFFICGVASFAGSVFVLYQSLSFATIVSVVLGKFCVSITYLVFIQAAEIFPTYLRSTGNSLSSCTGATAGIFTAPVVYAGQFYAGAPYLFLGLFSFIGAIAAAILPETLHQHLPETVDDAVAFGRDQKFWSWRTAPSSNFKDTTEPQATGEAPK